MNRTLATGAALAAFAMLAACGGGSSNNGAATGGNGTPSTGTPKVSVQDLAPGSYTVSVGDANAPTVGKYYAGDDGSRLLLVARADDQLETLYKRDASASSWTAIPPSTQEVQLDLLRSDRLVAQTPDLAALAGSYVAALPGGTAVRFRLDAGGAITWGDTACKLSGQLGAGKLPSTLALSLAAASCSGLPASSKGVLVIDSDYLPAGFRLVAENGSQLVDLWAYKE